ncbi:MAG: hypothetical protein ABGX07_10350 [Pirellulaceae bacterium]
MYEYEHTQSGTLVRVLIGVFVLPLGVAAIAILATGNSAEAAIRVAIPAVILAIALALFHSLTVRGSHNESALVFGIGLIRKSFVIHDIETAGIVRNRWYNGWGIKKIRGGWLYNVSGFDAIEIQLKNDRRYRIGTDQPQELLAAIESATAIAR